MLLKSDSWVNIQCNYWVKICCNLTEIGPTKRSKGVKIIAIADKHGLPLSVSKHAANHHKVTLVQLSLDFYMIKAKPDNLIGDKA